jgi:hypothetical protein
MDKRPCKYQTSLQTQSDAFYINCPAAEKDDHVALLIECMDQACKDILGPRVRIPVEISVYDSDSGYRDPRADQIEGMLQEFLPNLQVI